MESFTGSFFSLYNGNGYVKLDDGSEIFIYSENKGTAMHKDVVSVSILRYDREKAIGAVDKVIDRGNKFVMGTYQALGKRPAVVPDDKRIAQYIVLGGCINPELLDHKVSVKIVRPQSGEYYAEGRIIADLGHKDAPGVDIMAVVYRMEIPSEFSRKSDEEAELLPEFIDKDDYPQRVDLSGRLTVTIDSEDSKDIDDAVSLDKLDNGNFLLTVSIADVAHYVKENSALDRDALKRGTSVYLADRVIPMLPRNLSNGICSLNEGEFRLALSCEMEVSSVGKVLNHWIFESIVKVDKRMTYEKVSSYLSRKEANAKEAQIPEGYEKYDVMLKDMADLCQILKRKRVERGALEFDFPEAKAELDASGRAVGITLRERNTATAIIEEFMVLCNETVAEEFFWLELPFVYRCHEEPDTLRRRRFTEFLKNLGYSLRGKEARSYQTLLLKAKNSPEEAMIGNVMLRSLQQAKYSEINIGHFGLASKCYCHFTSPIRRYPDLQIHRIIKENLCQKLNGDRIAHYNEILPEVCKKTSFTERRAQNCERDVLNMKKVEYMSGKIGQEFEGVISGVINRGFFVTLENTSDGMVSVKNMGGDYFVYDEQSITLTGQATGQVFGLGKRVRVKLLSADVEAGKMDFLLV